MDAYEAILARRSVTKVRADAPSRAEIDKLLAAAVRAPNHHLTEPWRFIVLTGEALIELGEAWARGAERAGGDPDSVRDKPLRAPVVLCVIERPRTHAKVVEIEEHYAVGAALQNILLAAHVLGLGAMLRTGPATTLDEVRAYLGVGEDEFIAGFVYIGYPSEEDTRKLTRRTDPAEMTEWRGW